MATHRNPVFHYGDIVYHRCATEKQPGIVIAVSDYGGHYTYSVDWGPTDEVTENHEVTLTSKFVPDFTKGDE